MGSFPQLLTIERLENTHISMLVVYIFKLLQLQHM